jgi:hypothetical protein
MGRWLLAQAGATVGAVCVALHMLTALAPGHGPVPARALLLGMAAACIPCVRGLWSSPTRGVWATTGAMYSVMLGVHLLVLSPWPTTLGMHAHRHTGLTWTELGMWSGLALAAMQLMLVTVALVGGLTVVPVRQPSAS